ncbi:hypothetical protein BGZ49_009023 [Haplosporangium sp. Z 27]|nr:hypothetical protein BGZ49_009023 [Haplosporangium sp. Z 27]
MPPRRRNRNGNSITYSTSSSNGSQPLFSQSSNSSFIDEDSMNNVLQQVGQIFSSIIWYIWALLRGALMMLRPFFSIILAFVILVVLFGVLTNSLSIIKSVIHIRVCRLPLVPILLTCPSSGSDAFDSTMGHVPNFADLIKKQEASYQIIADSLSTLNPNFVYKKVVGKTRKRDKFKKIIMGDRANKGDGNHDDDDDDEDEDDPYGLAENSRERLPLPLLLKRAELAVVDLKVLVKHSGLPEMSRDLLVEQLEAFHTGAKTTGRQIQFLQARAHGCLDGLVIRNTYLIMELDRLEKKQLLLETNRDNAGIWDKMLDMILMSNGKSIQLI